MDASQTPTQQQPSPQPQAQAHAQAPAPAPAPAQAQAQAQGPAQSPAAAAKAHANARPKDEAPPSTGTWLKLDINDPEAEAAERAYLKESARVRRGVWIGNFVAGTVVAVVVAALGYVFLPRLGRPAGVSAAEVVGTDEQRRDAATVAAHISGQATMWKLQHYDRLPDFGRFPEWEQFMGITNTNGELYARDPRGGAAMCGPYLTAKPVNPINGRSNVFVTDNDVPPGAEVPGGPVGFVFSTMKLRFYVTDVAGTRVIDPTAKPELSPPSAADETREREQKAAVFAAGMQQLKAQLNLYRLQHNDELPDFEQYPGWEQLIGKTDASGKPAAGGQFGPYVDKPLKNPYTGTARVQVVTRAPGLRFRPASETVAYVLDTKAARVYGVDAEGKLSVGDSAAPVAAAPMPAPARPAPAPAATQTQSPAAKPAVPAARPTAVPAPAQNPSKGGAPARGRNAR